MLEMPEVGQQQQNQASLLPPLSLLAVGALGRTGQFSSIPVLWTKSPKQEAVGLGDWLQRTGARVSRDLTTQSHHIQAWTTHPSLLLGPLSYS